ncbi:GNAT family N-acetyltransferase [Streptomyces sp. NPDC057428]|uniref:GNAT family N-acetyltransferase n=1 Tax=Streptomyces sp. NPDC057428 TaxID=3346129 RepID=UPI0036CA27BB
MCPGQRSAPALDEGSVHVVATGETTHLRRGRPEDLDRVNAMHLRCTAASRYHRYQAPRHRLGHAEWARLTDPALGATWLMSLHDDPDGVIAVSHLMRTETEGVSELGLLVEDGWQYRGVGTLLTHCAANEAARNGSHTITVMTDAGNTPMLAIALRFGAALPRAVSGTVDLAIEVPRLEGRRG